MDPDWGWGWAGVCGCGLKGSRVEDLGAEMLDRTVVLEARVSPDCIPKSSK